ncbi:MAG: hypothetical protein AAFV88_26270 [Planctomycetota bacterium]
MSKRIVIPTRTPKRPSADQWVNQKSESSPKVKPKRLTIDIDPGLHRRLKVYCFNRDIVIANFLRGLIEEAVGEDCN